MNGDGSHQIRLWILGHACKYEMDSVIKCIVKSMTADEVFEGMKHCSEESINHVFWFLLLIRELINSLKTCQRNVENKYAALNKRLLSYVRKQLTFICDKNCPISVKQFLNLIMKLKCMEITLSLKEDPPVIVQQLNVAFPQMTQAYKNELQESLGLTGTDKAVLDKLQNSHTTFRRFILQLANSSKLRHQYISERLTKDMDKYMNYVLVNLRRVLKNLSQKAGPSDIEKILAESSEQQQCSFDPAVQLVLEYLQPEISEDNLINLLRSFDPDSQFIVDSTLMDTLSEIGSEADLGCVDLCTSSDNEEEEEDKADQEMSTVKKKKPLDTDTQAFDPLAGTSGGFVPADDEKEEIISDSEDESMP